MYIVIVKQKTSIKVPIKLERTFKEIYNKKYENCNIMLQFSKQMKIISNLTNNINNYEYLNIEVEKV